jgi:hypothetical protein
MAARLSAMRKYLPVESIWLNPDCGTLTAISFVDDRFENTSVARD